MNERKEELMRELAASRQRESNCKHNLNQNLTKK